MIAKNYVTATNNIKISLMKSCLETLYAFLSWIPLFYIFENNKIENVLSPLIKNDNFYILSIKC